MLQAIPVHRNKQKEEELDEKRPSRVITIKAAGSIRSRSRKKFVFLALRRSRRVFPHKKVPGKIKQRLSGPAALMPIRRRRAAADATLAVTIDGAESTEVGWSCDSAAPHATGSGPPTPLPGKPSCRGGQLAATWGSTRPCSYS